MATESRIKFSLFSSWDGKGLDEANKALKGTGQAADMAGKAINGALAAAGQQDGNIGKFASGLQSIIMGFKQGGIAGAALQVVMIGVGAAINATVGKISELKKECEELQKKTATMQGEITKTSLSIIDQSLADVKNASAEASKQLEFLIRQNQQLQGLSDRIQAGKTDLSIVQLQAEALRAVLAEETESGKKLVEARYKVMIAEAEQAKTAEDTAAKLLAANIAIDDAKKREKIATEKVARLKEELVAIDEREAKDLTHNRATRQQYEKKREALEKEIESASHEQIKASGAVRLAEKSLEATTIECEIEREKAANAVRSSIDSEMLLVDANEELAQEKEREAAAARMAAKAASFGANKQNIAANLMEERAKIDLEGNEKLRNLNTQIEAQKHSMERLTEQMEKAARGMAYDNANSNGGYNYQTNADGGIDDYYDWERAQRFGGRADRDAERGRRAQAAGRKKLADLRDKRRKAMEDGKKLNDKDQAALDRLEDWEKQLDGGKGQMKRLEELTEEQSVVAGQIKKKLEDIDNRIDKLTLK